MKRCSWVDLKSQIYIDYHDNEWGVPKYDDRELFELLILEGFQAGLSWLTILKKRDGFRKAFNNFDFNRVAKYNDLKIQELYSNDSIIKNKLKIKATINNANIFIKIREEFGSFSNYIWGFTNGKIIYKKNAETIVSSDLSDKISHDLKKRGMKFVGTVIIYSYLQAIGIINDHEINCFKFHN